MDLKGVLTPPIKEEVKRDKNIWLMTTPHHGTPAEREEIGIQHGIANYYTRLVWALGYGSRSRSCRAS
jgi:hypothetical protein